MSSPQQTPLSLDTVVCATTNQVSARVGDEVVILDLDGSLYYSLDPVGARIFELCQQATPLEEIRDALVAEFEVDTQTAGTDLLALVDELVARRLVEARARVAP